MWDWRTLKIMIHSTRVLISIFSFFFLAGWAGAQPFSRKSLEHPNSPADEQAPFVSPDGKVLYWTVANHADNIGGINEFLCETL